MRLWGVQKWPAPEGVFGAQNENLAVTDLIPITSTLLAHLGTPVSNYCCPHLSGKVTGAQRGQGLCEKSHSWLHTGIGSRSVSGRCRDLAKVTYK